MKQSATAMNALGEGLVAGGKTSQDKVIEFLLANKESTVSQIVKGIGLSASTVRRVLNRSGVLACKGLWADARGDHGIARWYVKNHLLTDTPNNGWLSPEGKLHVCSRSGHRCLAEGLHPEGELVLEKAGWMKLSGRNFLALLMDKPPTQAQIDRVYDYYRATNQAGELQTFMALAERRNDGRTNS